jgi:3-oxoacyl-[acyl-carrier protein] reductase
VTEQGQSPADPTSLAGRVALVTGGSRGIGRGIVLALVRRGAAVAFSYREREAPARELEAGIAALGGRAVALQCDVAVEEQVQGMAAEAAKALGPIDILVNNAGVTADGFLMMMDRAKWDRVLRVNLDGAYFCIRATVRAMLMRGWGRIINITSEVFHRAVAPFSAYVAAKGGQIGWSRSMARELAPFGITVNMVAPGWIPVERHEKDPQAEKDAYKALIPAGRWGVPKDVADAVLYLASEESSFVTGQTLCVNGGMTPW